MRLIDVDAMADRLDYACLVEALRRGHRAGIDAIERAQVSEGTDPATANHLLVLPAWRYGDLIGTKLVTVFPANAAPVPSIQTVYVLFDGRDGTPLAAMHGAQFTLRKTASDSALGASFLARSDVSRLLMVGAGNQAGHQIRAHCAVRPSLTHVAIWNRSAAKARALAAGLALPGVAVEAVDDLEAAARTADVVCCATSTTTPLLRGAWLQPGTHVDLVGGFTNAMREADDDVVRRGTLFVDSRWFTIGQCGDVTGPIEAGIIAEADIGGDLFELCAGKRPGRRSAEQITVFKNGGGGHLDLMIARLIQQVAVAG